MKELKPAQEVLQELFDKGYFALRYMQPYPTAKDYAKRFNAVCDQIGGVYTAYKLTPRIMSWMLPKVTGDHIRMMGKKGGARQYLVIDKPKPIVCEI